MPDEAYDVAILIADITGSTPLYERVGNSVALRMVEECLDELRAVIRRGGGMFVRSKGDDVLGTFDEPSAAFWAAREMTSRRRTGALTLHVGLHHGQMIRSRGELYGEAINLTARVAAMARPGEVLATADLVERLPEPERARLRMLDSVVFRGKSVATEVYVLLDEDEMLHTQMSDDQAPGHTRARYRGTAPAVTVSLSYAGGSLACGDQQRVRVGRSSECDIVIERPWVSRNHLMVSVQQGKVQLADESSSGTYVSIPGAYAFFMRRESVLLTASGIISPGQRPDEPDAQVIRYEVRQLVE